jgi:hypothetical protein
VFRAASGRGGPLPTASVKTPEAMATAYDIALR